MLKKLLQNKNLLTLILAFSVGVLFILFGVLGEDASETQSDNSLNYSTPELESYTSALEKRITAHLEKIEGVKLIVRPKN